MFTLRAQSKPTWAGLPLCRCDSIYLRRNWGGEYESVAIFVAIAVNEDSYREVLGVSEGMKEDKASWVNFFTWIGIIKDGFDLLHRHHVRIHAVKFFFLEGSGKAFHSCVVRASAAV